MEQNAEAATVPVDLTAADLVAALSSELPREAKGALVRAALARQGASLLDLRDAQRRQTRSRLGPEQRAALDARLDRSAAEAEAFYSDHR